MRWRHAIGAAALSVLVSVSSEAAAQQPYVRAAREREVLRGTITDERGVPLPGAIVRATRAPDRMVFTDTTDRGGQYQIVVAEGTGDYLLHVALEGYRPVRIRVVENGAQSLFVNDVSLAPAVAQLTSVRVQARRVVPRRNENAAAEVGAAEQTADNFAGTVLPELKGDIAATAAALPGVMATPDGVSILGLGPEQNRVTLGGLSFAGASIPRSVGTVTRVASSSYDPAVGWGSGAQIAVDVRPGGLFSFRNAHTTVDAPQFQSHGVVPEGLSQRYAGVVAGMGGGGPVDKGDRYFYTAGVEGSRVVAPLRSLVDAAPAALAQAGVSPDSVGRLLRILPTVAVPLGMEPRESIDERLTVFGRIDRSATDPVTSRPARHTLGVTGYLDVARQSSTRAGADVLLIAPTTLRRGERAMAAVQGMHSGYFREGWLSDTRTAFSVSEQRALPVSPLPLGIVDVASTLSDGAVTGSQLHFGGGGGQASRSRQWTWETLHETQGYVANGTAHRVKVAAGSRLDGYRHSTAGEATASVGYGSLEDVAASRPTYFSSVTSGPAAQGGAWNGFASIGDLWRVNQNLRLLLGLRAEGTIFTAGPDYGARIREAFGSAVGGRPDAWHISPRAGFTWNVRNGGSGGIRVTPLGALANRRLHIIRGGIGEFRNMLSPQLLSRAMVANGQTAGRVRLLCVGAAVPDVDWASWARDPGTIPDACVDGAPALVDEGRPVEVFDPDYTAARSWRANLAYSSQWRFVNYTVEGTYSLNLNQPSTTDLNFDGVSKFRLADDGRPVYVDKGGIVPASGVAALSSARRIQDLGPVTGRHADGRSVSRQLTVVLSPDLGRVSHWYSSVAYTLGSVRARERGFDATTTGDPLQWGWARGALDARHQVTVIAAGHGENVGISLVGRARSGFPYTPIVARDINGDGLANDAAFIYAEGQANEPDIDTVLDMLRNGGSGRISRCLREQAGTIAARRSCEGPWTGSLDGYLTINTRLLPGRRSLRFGLGFSNMLAAIDQVLHGENRRGWGETLYPDPVLYQVSGFDPASDRYRYVVNPRFGSAHPGAAGRTLRPFRLTLEVTMDLGRPIPEQQVQRWLRPGRGGYPGNRLSEDALRERYWRTVPDPYAGILAEADSLLLSRPQVSALQAAQSEFKAVADSMWNPLVRYLADLNDDFDAAEALRRQETTTQAVLDFVHSDMQRVLPQILDPIQLRLLPDPAHSYFHAKRGTQDGRRFRL